MTDRELLELAAKAADIKLLWTVGGIPTNIPTRFSGLQSSEVWNPLTDDGDALHLAVRLRMAIDIGGGGFVSALCGEPECTEDVQDIEPDPYAATRRAIVSAAAEIGRGMK